jgi:hypothetical protein
LSTGLALSGCEDTKLMEMFDGKKKLPGERKEVFPGGQVPGVQAGVPPELVKGYQAPVDPAAATPQGEGGAPAAQAEPEPEKPAPPPKPKRVAKPKPKPQPVAASAPVQQPQVQQQQPQTQQDGTPQPQFAQPRAWPGATPAGPPSDRFSR